MAGSIYQGSHFNLKVTFFGNKIPLFPKSVRTYVLGVRTQIVISNSSLRERRGYTKFYYITDLFSVDMAIYDSIVSFQKIDAY